MGLRLKRWLWGRGWIFCDRVGCRKTLPRTVAYRRGWFCGGIAGSYDFCKKHL